MCDALRDLVPFVQFKKCDKHPWRSVTFSNPFKSNVTPYFNVFVYCATILRNLWNININRNVRLEGVPCEWISVTLYSIAFLVDCDYYFFCFEVDPLMSGGNKRLYYSVHRVINPPTPTPLSCQASPLNLQTFQAPPFLGNPHSLYIRFSWTPSPLKVEFFIESPKY